MGFISMSSCISIHAPHTGRDSRFRRNVDTDKAFQSTRPIRGATKTAKCSLYYTPISIHAPHTGRDVRHSSGLPKKHAFQSTRPIRGATCGVHQHIFLEDNFNPRAPYGARRHFRTAGRPLQQHISIHAPHTGRDLTPAILRRCPENFNPRAPYGARPASFASSCKSTSISIHAPHTGRDYSFAVLSIIGRLFQSTRPIRGATWHTARTATLPKEYFNPRAPYGARLSLIASPIWCCLYFNPRAPYGARPVSET